MSLVTACSISSVLAVTVPAVPDLSAIADLSIYAVIRTNRTNTVKAIAKTTRVSIKSKKEVPWKVLYCGFSYSLVFVISRPPFLE